MFIVKHTSDGFSVIDEKANLQLATTQYAIEAHRVADVTNDLLDLLKTDTEIRSLLLQMEII